MDASPALPTETWLGFEEYEAQRAPRAEFEQAAFLPDDAATRAAAAAIMTNGTPPSVSAREAFEKPVQDAPINQTPRPVTAQIDAAHAHRAERPDESQARDPVANAAEPAAMANEQQTGDEGNAASTAALSDRESDPTSIINAPPETWRLGKPLAAQGLELKPRRPQFTELTLLTAWPRDPLVSIAFDHDGKPIRAAIAEKTGDKRVDEAILASLYRWRAAGAPLRALPEGETIEVRIRLVLNGQ